MSKISNLLDQIDRALKPLDVLNHPSEENFKWLIDTYLPRLPRDEYFERVLAYEQYLHNDTLSEAERERKFYFADIIPQMVTQFGMLNGASSGIARRVVANWYSSWIIERKLSGYNTLLDILARREDLVKYIYTRESIQYIQFLSGRLLKFFWAYAYKLNKQHKNCGGKIKYGQVQDAKSGHLLWAWYCSRCLKTLSDSDLDTQTLDFM